MVDRQKQLLRMIEQATGKAAYAGEVAEEGEELHGDEDSAQAPIYAELCSIVQKTVGLVEPLREALAPLAARIRAAFVYGGRSPGTKTQPRATSI